MKEEVKEIITAELIKIILKKETSVDDAKLLINTIRIVKEN